MASTAHMHDNHCMYLCAGNTVTIFSLHELLLLSWVIWPMDILFLYNLLNNKMGIKILVPVHATLICRIWMYLLSKS